MIILGTNSIKATGGYDVANSLRFNDGSSDYLNRTPASASNRDKFTFSCWVKRGTLFVNGGGNQVFLAVISSGNYSQMYFSGDTVMWDEYPGSMVGRLKTNRLFRDNSAWYHLVFVWDSANATAGNRMRLYVNGSEETSFSTDTQPSSGQDSYINSDSKHMIGGHDAGSGEHFDGYMAEVCLIDGQALDPTSFGEFDSDSPTIWKPKDVSGLTFGTNGFYLDFENASSLGADVSGNSNNFTVNNLTSVDQSTDTCTNNFATLNPLGMPSTNTTFSEGNLTVNVASGSSFWSVPTIGVSSGKWYVEGKLVTGTADGGLTYSDYGFVDRSDSAGQSLYASSARAFWLSAWDSKINYRTGGSTTAGLQTSKTGLSQGDFFQLYLDMDNELMYWGRNGSVTNSTGISFNGKESLTGEYFFAFADQFTNGTYKYSTNFGQGSIDGSAVANFQDANGFGNFKYNPTVTTDEGSKDFLALCTKNLAEHG